MPLSDRQLLPASAPVDTAMLKSCCQLHCRGLHGTVLWCRDGPMPAGCVWPCLGMHCAVLVCSRPRLTP